MAPLLGRESDQERGGPGEYAQGALGKFVRGVQGSVETVYVIVERSGHGTILFFQKELSVHDLEQPASTSLTSAWHTSLPSYRHLRLPYACGGALGVLSRSLSVPRTFQD